MNHFASLCIPTVLLAATVLIFCSRHDLFSAFTDGISDGMRTTVRILPVMLSLTVAVRMISASGALEYICRLLAPVCIKLGIDSDLLPILLIRPLSGSGATAMLMQLFSDTTPDSFASRTASVIMGSSDTILYTVSVYFASVGQKKTGRTLPLAFAVLIFCTVLSCIVTKTFFGR